MPRLALAMIEQVRDVQIVLRYFDAGSLLVEERVVVPPVGRVD